MDRWKTLGILMIAAAGGCSDDAGTAPPVSSTESALAASPSHDRGTRDESVTVMTRNVYIGFDIAPVLAAPSAEAVPLLVAAAWAQMEGNDFTARAGAIAREIEDANPELVGLQEVARLTRLSQATGTPTVIDYRAILEQALAARGLHYDVVVEQQDSLVQVPLFAGLDASGAPILDLVEFVDHDLVLARADVKTSSPESGNYAIGLPVTVAGTSVEIVRGWASVVVDAHRGRSFRFVSTHLEEQLAPPVQEAQAAELLGLLAFETRPIVLVGDFNSAGDGSQTPTYATISGAGYVDLWRRAHGHAPGYTCCQPADLHQSAKLDQRLDLVFVRDGACGRGRLDDHHVRVDIVGDSRRDRTASGLWPSDHAGVVASFELEHGAH